MKQKLIYSLIIFLMPFMAFCQGGTVQNANIPKDAPVNVSMTDFKNNILNQRDCYFQKQSKWQGIPGTNRYDRVNFLPVYR